MPIVFERIDELLTMPSDRRGGSDEDLGLVRDAAVVSERGRVAWVGPRDELPAAYDGADRVRLNARLVLPGLVDAHTHLVFAGDRTRDFADRCAGESYEAIAARGGGIRLTVGATRDASVDTLAELARPRLVELLARGVTTVEVKSGYGLTVAKELEMLEVVRRLDASGPWRLIPTVLGAHIVPDEYRDDRAAWVRAIVRELLPEAASRGLARHVDVFCETGAYTLDETLEILEAGRSLGLGLKVHAEQLTRTGAASEAAKMGAVSTDHLEHLSPDDAAVLAETGTTAVLLPGAAIFLGGRTRAPARTLLDAGASVALSTDCNPGTCPSTHLPMMATLGCVWLGMAPHEAVRAITSDAARAVGLDDGTGTLQPGAPCDFAVLDLPGWRHLAYRFAADPVREVWTGGRRALARTPPKVFDH